MKTPRSRSTPSAIRVVGLLDVSGGRCVSFVSGIRIDVVSKMADETVDELSDITFEITEVLDISVVGERPVSNPVMFE